jgi:hypothetical protein
MSAKDETALSIVLALCAALALWAKTSHAKFAAETICRGQSIAAPRANERKPMPGSGFEVCSLAVE